MYLHLLIIHITVSNKLFLCAYEEAITLSFT